MALERVDKILASCTLYSRKEIKKQIQKGAVLADGSVVLSPEQKYDPLDTAFVVDGAKVQYQKQVYLMLNKPRGYVTTHGRQTGKNRVGTHFSRAAGA